MTSTPVPNPTPDVGAVMTQTLNPITNATTTFFSTAWPIIVVLCVTIIFAMIVFAFSTGMIQRHLKRGKASS